MAISTGAFHDRINTLLTSATGVQKVYKGHPGSWTHEVTAYSTVGGQIVDHLAIPGTLIRTVRVFIEAGFRVKDNAYVDECETKLGTFIDSFTALFFADLRTGFGGITTDGELELNLGDEPEYWRMLGKENRTYPLVAVARGRQTW